jgi:hypothetical protein
LKSITIFYTFFISLIITPNVAISEILQEDIAIYTTLNQIKAIVYNNENKNIVEENVKNVRKKRPHEFKYNSYKNNEAGWTVYDNQKREVIIVVFSFVKNKAKMGRYIGLLVNAENSGLLHSFHRGVLDRNFQKISRDRYSLGDSCVADLNLFQEGGGMTRSIIFVECSNL